MAMLVEPTDQDGQLTDYGLPGLVGGVHNLRQGQQAKAYLTMLFRNSVNVTKEGKPDIKAPITARGDELAKQLKLEDNEFSTSTPTPGSVSATS